MRTTRTIPRFTKVRIIGIAELAKEMVPKDGGLYLIEMTPEQEKQKKRILDAEKELREAIASHECFIPDQKEADKWGCYGLAVCAVCRRNFSWWCPNSPDHLCNYDPPGNSDDCNYCHQPDERK